MKTVLRATGVMAVLGALGATALPAQEQQHRERRAERAGHEMSMGYGEHMQGTMDPMMRITAFAPPGLLEHRKQLGLSAEQVTQLEALAEEIRTAHQQAKSEGEQHHKQLMEVWSAASPDVQAITSHAQGMMDAHHQAHLAAVVASAQARAILTAAQRGRVDGWLDVRSRIMHQRRMKEHRDDDGDDDGPHG